MQFISPVPMSFKTLGFRIHPADLGKRLARLVGLGLLKPSGRGRGTKYCLPPAQSSSSAPLSPCSNGEMSELLASVSHAIPPQNRTSQVDMGMAILDLCSHQWMCAADLAAILHRDIRTIRRLCNALLSDNRLILRHPETPRHPHQAYRAANANSSPDPSS